MVGYLAVASSGRHLGMGGCHLMGLWQIVWLGWILAFGVLETWAIVLEIRGYQGATLSENLRAWLGIYPHRAWRLIGTSLVVAGSLWFVVHITIQH